MLRIKESSKFMSFLKKLKKNIEFKFEKKTPCQDLNPKNQNKYNIRRYKLRIKLLLSLKVELLRKKILLKLSVQFQ